MRQGTTICAVDVGTTLIKATVRRGPDEVLARSSVRFPNEPDEGEISIHGAVWRAFASALRQVCVSYVPDTMILSGQMAGLSLIGDDGGPLGPLLPGVQLRTPQYGALPDLSQSGCADMGTSSVPKFLWCRENLPRAQTRALRIGGIKEYLLYLLTGRWVTDPASASASGFYDMETGTWSAQTLRATNTTEENFADIAEMDVVIGEVHSSVANECGIPPGTAVLCGLGDGPAANMSSGAVGPHRMCFSHGTTVVARILFAGKVPDLRPMPVFTQHVHRSWKCVGLRFVPDPDSMLFIPTGRPTERLTLSDIYHYLRPLMDAFDISDVRSVGGRPVALPEFWRTREMTDAQDGTRGMALVASGAGLPQQASSASDQAAEGMR